MVNTVLHITTGTAGWVYYIAGELVWIQCSGGGYRKNQWYFRKISPAALLVWMNRLIFAKSVVFYSGLLDFHYFSTKSKSFGGLRPMEPWLSRSRFSQPAWHPHYFWAPSMPVRHAGPAHALEASGGGGASEASGATEARKIPRWNLFLAKSRDLQKKLLYTYERHCVYKLSGLMIGG